jgi:cbb3-type cytochrome oxidase maturation protein
MNALLVLVPVTVVLVLVATGIFFWAVNHAQFDDMDTPKILPLLDGDDGVTPGSPFSPSPPPPPRSTSP